MCRFVIDSKTKTDFFKNISIINSRAATLSFECDMKFLQFLTVWPLTRTFNTIISILSFVSFLDNYCLETH